MTKTTETSETFERYESLAFVVEGDAGRSVVRRATVIVEDAREYVVCFNLYEGPQIGQRMMLQRDNGDDVDTSPEAVMFGRRKPSY